MEETILCYGIKSKFGLTQIKEISFDDLGKSDYDFQVAFETVFNNGGNGSINLLLVKDGQKVNLMEFECWKIQNLHIGWNWSGTLFEAEVTDPLGDNKQFELAGDKGPMSPYQLSYVELLRQGFNELNRICTFGSISMLDLCDRDFTNFSSSTLSSYNATLNYMSEFCKKVEVIRERLRKNPGDKDVLAYNNIIKPKMVKYMEELSKVRINLDMLNL